MAREKRGGRTGGRTGRRGRPPGNRNRHEESEHSRNETESVHMEHNDSGNHESVHDDAHNEALELEPIVKEAIAVEVTSILKKVLPEALGKALKEFDIEKKEKKEESSKRTEVTDSDDSDYEMATRGCNYKSFRGCDSPKYDGRNDDIATFEWIERMNGVINISECRDDQAVKFGAHSFTNEALSWWRSIERIKSFAEMKKMKWDDMKKLLITKFCPQNKIDRVEREFLGLYAGSMTHRQYTSKYQELAQLVPHLVDTEKKRIKYYLKGLPQRVRVHVKANAPTSFEYVVSLAGIAYDDFESVDPLPTEKKVTNIVTRPTKQWAGPETKKLRIEDGTDCAKCGRKHSGECRMGLNICYRYHLDKECRKPKAPGTEKGKEVEKSKARTRAYALTQEEARGNPDVVSGTFILDHTFVSVLFDSGASRSFISSSMCRRMKCKVTKVEHAFNVETAVGKTRVVNELTKDDQFKQSAAKAISAADRGQPGNNDNTWVVDSGCSRHMIGNKSILSDFINFYGGYVAFGSDSKGGSITGQETVSNERMSIERHRRLSHVNVKTINKLVKGNLVRGLPDKEFQLEDHCIACLNGKQHKSSHKPKTLNSNDTPLQLLHMDLFGPTNVMSMGKKSYCLVITDDYTRFSLVYFLRTKDETTEILKSYILRVENQSNQKVKIIRCDQGTKFKNQTLNCFCESKGIERQYSAPRTPQQNGVAERKTELLLSLPDQCWLTQNCLSHSGQRQLSQLAMCKIEFSLSSLSTKHLMSCGSKEFPTLDS
ncbi:hypothetical protein L1987_27832 [Smallanthus sonchifolius]|uniref:Uncharacterized protein n=1 Tax=Smallanthus sonchifolius TaxID=185202 RepID=A0ACB9IDI1_9ASTR|nr:hypothetical protein L1987_27832 [Smallanthus sonchifolius]